MRSTRPLVLSSSLILLSTLLAGSARAQISPEQDAFGRGPASHWFTAQDKAAWKKLNTAAEAEDFIALFWARRDPDPKTAVNEFRQEFEARSAYADREFAETRGKEKVRGAMTDRGKVLILLGVPTKASKTDTSDFDQVDDEGGLGEYYKEAREGWRYERDRLPAKLGVNKLMVWFETEAGYGVSVLSRDGKVLTALGRVVELAVTQPQATLAEARAAAAAAPAAAPAAATPAFYAWRSEGLGEAASAAELQAMAAGQPRLVAFLDAAPFKTHDGSWIVPVQVMARDAVTGDASYALVGRLLTGGDEKLSFRGAAPWRSSKRQSILQTTVVAPPGSYELLVGVLDPQGQLVWAGKKAVDVPAASSELWVSQLVLSNDLGKLAQAQEMLQPWAWEGIAVVPKGDGVFRQGEALAYYLHACQVGKTDVGAPDLRLSIELTGPKRFRGPQQIQPLKNGPDCWIVAGGFDLAANTFPAGEYELKAQLTDAVANKTATTAKAFRIETAGK